MQEKDALVGIYNDKRELIGAKRREEVDKKRDIIKTANVVLFNNANEIFMIKDRGSVWKGKWGGSCAGLVRRGESEEEAALRTLNRELGIKTKINFIGSEFCDFGDAKRIFAVFVGSADKNELEPNKEDFYEWKWVNIGEAHKMVKKGECMPPFEKALEMINIKC